MFYFFPASTPAMQVNIKILLTTDVSHIVHDLFCWFDIVFIYKKMLFVFHASVSYKYTLCTIRLNVDNPYIVNLDTNIKRTFFRLMSNICANSTFIIVCI